MLIFDKLAIDLSDNGDLFVRPLYEHHAIRRDAFVFPAIQYAFFIAAFIDEHSAPTETRSAALPISEAYEAALPLQSFDRSEEHTSELQSLMRISYAVFCLNKKKMSIKAR